jgi:hypothetical protein
MSTNLDLAQGLALTAGAATVLARTRYFPGAPHQSFQFGSTFNRLFKPNAEVIKSVNKDFQVIRGRSDGARYHRSPLQDWRAPKKMTTAKITVRYNEEVEASNDFFTGDVSAQIAYTDFLRGAAPEEQAVNLVEEVTRQFMDSMERSRPILCHAPASGRIALVNGEPKLADTYDWASATAYANNATAVRIRIDGGSIAPFEPNMRFDIYDSAGNLEISNIEVVTKNAADNSVWFKVTADSNQATFGTSGCDVDDNSEIFRSGERNLGFKSGIGNWFSEPASGDSFIGGVDRSTEGYAWLVPPLSRTESTISNATISQAILDEAIGSMELRRETGSADELSNLVFLGHTTHANTLREDISAAAIVQQAPTNRGEYTFGAMSIKYMHPAVGIIDIVGDPLAPLDEVKLIKPSDWSLHYYNQMGPFVPPRGDLGMFYFTEGEAAGSGRSKYLRVDATETAIYMCSNPSGQHGIKAVIG